MRIHQKPCEPRTETLEKKRSFHEWAVKLLPWHAVTRFNQPPEDLHLNPPIQGHQCSEFVAKGFHVKLLKRVRLMTFGRRGWCPWINLNKFFLCSSDVWDVVRYWQRSGFHQTLLFQLSCLKYVQTIVRWTYSNPIWPTWQDLPPCGSVQCNASERTAKHWQPSQPIAVKWCGNSQVAIHQYYTALRLKSYDPSIPSLAAICWHGCREVDRGTNMWVAQWLDAVREIACRNRK